MNRNSNGFTLIELMIAMVIATIVIGGIIYSYTGQQNSQLSQKQVVEMQQNIRAAMYIMAIDIRMAGYDPYQSYGAGIASAGDGSSGNPLTFTFVSDDDGIDNDGDGRTDERGELKTISFQLYDAYGDGDYDIGMQVGNGTNQVIAENISNFQFTYLDTSGNTTTVASDVKAVQITITASVDINSKDYTTQNATRTVSTVVECRNLNL